MGVGDFFSKLLGSETAPANEAVLRAYGKLPMYAEYRRLEVSPGTPTVFSQWMDAGRLAWVRSPTKSEHATTRTSRLMLRLPESKELVIASIWDSRDSLGRVFPFAFFVTTPPEALGADNLERWVAAREIHLAFDRFHGEIGQLGRGGDFYRHYQKRFVTLKPDNLSERVAQIKQEAGRINADEWLRGWMPDGQAQPAAWYAGLVRRADRWRAQPATVNELAVSCPLAPQAGFAAQALCWLTFLDPVLQKAGRQPSLMISAEERSSGALHLVARNLLPDDFQLLTTDAAAYGYVERLAASPSPSGSEAPAPAATPTGLLDWLAFQAAKPA